MRKIFVSIALALVLTLVSAAAVFADDTTVEVDWDGGGIVGGVVTAGDDATITWGAAGSAIEGSFDVTDKNDNPYNYGVDSVGSYMVSKVTDGFSSYQVDRNDSKISYGPDGQTSRSYIAASGGTAEFAMGTSINYASLGVYTHGKPRTGTSSKNFEANADEFVLQQWVGNGDLFTLVDRGNWASFTVDGSGTALVDCMMSGAASGVRLGWGGGCFTDANMVLDGDGTVYLDAVGSNGIRTPIAGNSGTLSPGGWTIPGDGTFGSTSLSIVASYAGDSAWSIPNYSMDVT